MTITHDVTPPVVDPDSTKLVITGNNYTSNYAFNLFSSKGSWISEVSSLPAASNAWYRVAKSNSVSTLNPVTINIGMNQNTINQPTYRGKL